MSRCQDHSSWNTPSPLAYNPGSGRGRGWSGRAQLTSLGDVVQKHLPLFIREKLWERKAQTDEFVGANFVSY
jgi:hypothetical protein